MRVDLDPVWLAVLGLALALAAALLAVLAGRKAKTPGAAAGAPRTARADAQNPLPEASWFMRRVLVFASFFLLVAPLLWGVVLIIGALGKAAPAQAIKGLVVVACWVITLSIVDRVLYLVAPSADELVRLSQWISALKKGVSFRSEARASEGDAVATSRVEASGPAPAPPADPDK